MKKPNSKSAANPVVTAIFNKGLLTVALILIANSVFAQSATASQLNGFKQTFTNIVNVIFLIGVIYGIVNVCIGFFGQHKEGAMKNLMYLVIGIIIWACFNAFFGDFGGSTKIAI